MKAFLAVALLTACFRPWEPQAPFERIAHTPTHVAWYDEVWRSCASVAREHPGRSLDELTLYVVHAPAFLSPSGTWAAGSYSRTTGRVYVVVDAPIWVYKHEFLHAQLDVKSHPPLFYACGLMASQNAT